MKKQFRKNFLSLFIMKYLRNIFENIKITISMMIIVWNCKCCVARMNDDFAVTLIFAFLRYFVASKILFLDWNNHHSAKKQFPRESKNDSHDVHEWILVEFVVKMIFTLSISSYFRVILEHEKWCPGMSKDFRQCNLGRDWYPFWI